MIDEHASAIASRTSRTADTPRTDAPRMTSRDRRALADDFCAMISYRCCVMVLALRDSMYASLARRGATHVDLTSAMRTFINALMENTDASNAELAVHISEHVAPAASAAAIEAGYREFALFEMNGGDVEVDVTASMLRRVVGDVLFALLMNDGRLLAHLSTHTIDAVASDLRATVRRSMRGCIRGRPGSTTDHRSRVQSFEPSVVRGGLSESSVSRPGGVPPSFVSRAR
jgi:hypothetical protein